MTGMFLAGVVTDEGSISEQSEQWGKLAVDVSAVHRLVLFMTDYSVGLI